MPDALTIPGLPVASGQTITDELWNDSFDSIKSKWDARFGALTAGHIFVANASGVITGVAMSGDGTISQAGALTVTDLAAVKSQAGITAGGIVRRGKSIIATQETTTSATYTTLTTPDQVSNVVLPTDGLIVVGFQAYAKTDVNASGRAAIFLGANQLKGPGTVPAVVETPAFSSGANDWSVVVSTSVGLTRDSTGSVTSPAVVTTGMVLPPPLLGGGLCSIWAAAGTYTVSVQWKTSSGTLTAKERRLWVWTMGF